MAQYFGTSCSLIRGRDSDEARPEMAANAMGPAPDHRRERQCLEDLAAFRRLLEVRREELDRLVLLLEVALGYRQVDLALHGLR